LLSAEAAEMTSNPFRELPSVDTLAVDVRAQSRSRLDDAHLTRLVQRRLEDERRVIREGGLVTRGEVIERAVADAAAFERDRLRPVINATGVIVHTNLGRAPVSDDAAAAMAAAAAGYVALEIDPETNDRGGRMDEISALMRLLTGAERTLIVNNNAAAVLLTLSALAASRRVIVSRGEAVEIGGGFRVPDVLWQSGAELIDVGTTNRTYVRDYEAAIDERTALILKVHPSNFVVEGFTTTPNMRELVDMAASSDVPVIEDLGSGALLDTTRFGLAKEPTIGERLAEGAALVTASGDKLLGGPQAGIIAGRADLVERIERHPLARAVRADKTCLAGLAATLRHYARGEALERLPVWRMIAAIASELAARADALRITLIESAVEVTCVETRATVGGGSLPGETLPSFALAMEATAGHLDSLARALRTGSPPVFTRIEGQRLLFHLRTVLPEQDASLAAAIAVGVNARLNS